MSANTSPDNIVYPVSTDNIAPLETVFSVMAGSVQDALDVRQAHSYKWANATARGAQTGMAAGDSGYQSDTDTYWNYNGTAWDYTGSTVQLKMGTVSSVIVSTPQRGIEKITGAAATKITKTVTFPVAYSTIPVVTASAFGGRAVGAFNASGLISVSAAVMVSISATSATGFTADMTRTDSANLSASYDYYLSWAADGVTA
jgi:hypothetical protein